MTHLTSNLKYWPDSSSSLLPWLQSLWGVQQNIYWGWKDLQSHCTLSTSVSFWVFESLEAASPVRYDWTVVCVYRCSNVVHTVMLVFNAAPPEASQVFSVCFQRCPPMCRDFSRFESCLTGWIHDITDVSTSDQHHKNISKPTEKVF